MTNKPLNTKLYSQVVDLLQSAKQQVVRSVNQTMVLTYFEIGRMLVEEEQGGKERAEYGKELLKGLSKVLTKEFGKGFSVQNLERMRSFYLVYRKSSTLLGISQKAISSTPLTKSEMKSQTPSAIFQLSWSHYLKLIIAERNSQR